MELGPNTDNYLSYLLSAMCAKQSTALQKISSTFSYPSVCYRCNISPFLRLIQIAKTNEKN